MFMIYLERLHLQGRHDSTGTDDLVLNMTFSI